tara:strand:- start:186 stop:1904 length:1719 start_codon:yes stop_codon:yes gene_type:complete
MALTKVHNRMVSGSYVNVLDYGVTGDASTDDAAAIQAAFTAAGIGSVVYFPPLTYSIGSTVTIPDPHNVTVMAHGAVFKLTADTLMFDLNGRADPTYADNESRQNFNWYGGRFGCTITTPTKACAMRALGFRHATIDPEDFGLTNGGFYNDIITGGKDTVRIRNYKTFDCEDSSILFPPWSSIGGPLMFAIENIHSSIGTNDASLLKSYMPLTDCLLQNFSCNMGTGATQTAIDVQKSVCLGLSSLGGNFSVGETITGGTSGATGVFVELYTHQFPFQITSNLQWIVLSDRNSNLFAAGETLTGGTSGVTAVIGSNAGYLVQDDPFTNFNIDGSNHFEAGSGASGATCIRIADIEKRGAASLNFDIAGCTLGVNGGGSFGIKLENINRLKVNNVRFAQTTGNGTSIQYDSRCTEMVIGRPAFFSTGAIDLNGMSRDELEMSEFDVLFDRVKVITGWTPKVLSTASGTIIDMSADFNQFATIAGLSPKSYGLTISAKDSGSAATANARFRIHHPDEATTNYYSLLGVGGVPDDTLRSGYFLVGGDANGDIEYDAIASGAATLDVYMTVTEMKY